jgi:CheY-like chemotaxis protein
MNVLLIEPDAMTARNAKQYLHEQGLVVQTARSGQQAVDILDQQAVDVILLEPQLGVHNGIEFLYELRSYVEWMNIPVVVWTLNKKMLGPQFANAWRQLGVTQVCYKPETSLRQLARVTHGVSVANR